MAALQGYVLHRYDWSETSLILDVFTRERGRLALAAKGAKRPYSQLRSVLLPFQRVTLSVGKATAEVQTLRGAEWAGGGAMLGGAALFSGFYLNELLMKLLQRDDPHPVLFDAYALTLAALGGGDGQAALRAFELVLLQELGVLPELAVVTATQAELEPAARYVLSPEGGLAPARAGAEGAVPGATWVQLQAALSHGSLAALQQACAGALGELRPALRVLVQHQLGSTLLRTREVMRELQGL